MNNRTKNQHVFSATTLVGSLRQMSNGWTFFSLFCLLSFCSCDFDYYGHLVAGQSKIILERTSVADIIALETTSNSLRTQFELVGSILSFAKDLGLNTGDSYQTFYDTEGEPISWNISASPADSFSPYSWQFPIVGALPYKGFFFKPRAEKAYQQLVEEGFDAILRPVSAYSTLGYFVDPLLSTMLNDSPDELADLILHELTHGTIFAEGHTDYNESLATFVGQKGSLLFLAYHFGPQTEHIISAQHKRTDAAKFRQFMGQVVSSLDSLYAMGLPRSEVLVKRVHIFSLAQEDFRETLPNYHNANYIFFLQWKINNARLLSYRRYHNRLDLFEAIYSRERENMSKSMAIFSICSANDDPWKCLESYAD